MDRSAERVSILHLRRRQHVMRHRGVQPADLRKDRSRTVGQNDFDLKWLEPFVLEDYLWRSIVSTARVRLEIPDDGAVVCVRAKMKWLE